ncbi:hypothetical protein PG993_005586 [Apiospora rasikravindrae]|uniref:Rhodopsin domain-containing protein n=1 Tax=Apiospora rasikravindrae TaxID=990691 RepID=A0ABR1TGP6_9PEZI
MAPPIPPETVQLLPPELQAQIPLYDENLQPNLYAADAICLVAAYIAVTLRLYARRLKVQPLGWDDYMILVALLFTTVFVSLCIFVAAYGMGRHTIVTVLEHPERSVPFAKATLAAGVIYNPALVCTKISILLLYHRLFPGKRLKWACVGVGTFTIAYSITAIMTNIFQCVPVESNWDTTITPHCVDLGAELVAVSSLNVVTDAAILCLPMPIIWRLKTSFRRKLQLTSMFLLGIFVVAVSIIRVTYVSGVSFSDGFWVNTFPSMWSVVESCVAIVAACLPTLRPVFNLLIHGDPEGSTRQKGTSGGPPDRNIVTIGGHSIPMKNVPLQGTNRSNTLAVSQDPSQLGSSFERLRDNDGY